MSLHYLELCRRAKDYLDAANELNPYADAYCDPKRIAALQYLKTIEWPNPEESIEPMHAALSFPAYFLYFHAIELMLKSHTAWHCLTQCTRPAVDKPCEKTCMPKNLGHDLAKALKKAK